MKPDSRMEAALARHFSTLPRAYAHAVGRAIATGDRQFVCHRLGYRWYVLGPLAALAARGNPNWPGARFKDAA